MSWAQFKNSSIVPICEQQQNCIKEKECSNLFGSGWCPIRKRKKHKLEKRQNNDRKGRKSKGNKP